MKRLLLALLVSIIHVFPALSQQPAVLPLKAQAELIDSWLDYRIENVLPDLMTETGIDMWIVISREYNEDPVIRTLLPATWMAARRRTILVMYQPEKGGKVETFAIARYDVGKAFKRAWDTESQPDQWEALMDLIKEKNPKKIGLNVAKDYGHADGLTKT
ncbi:MAG: Xaa-Pro aminopeptidase, partial [Cyclobacteriaceae bacterium]|nr:Xaa-Pro aminopeptidase [Cyclobacteriaceae bacterium]